nr:protein SHOOT GRAVITROPISM 5-like [Ipomoea batatas]
MNGNNPSSSTSQPFAPPENGGNNSKRKRRPAGTPDPDAEVVSLSPKTLLESDRYVCEICNQGFQRDQNLQMHRRRHKVPWKLLKRETPVVRKRVFVCPEPTCLHHDPCHALGDLVGIKKHFRRKHSNHKQWVCDKCSKAYAVQSDYKAHLKTCGTRGHSCDCGRVFSRSSPPPQFPSPREIGSYQLRISSDHLSIRCCEFKINSIKL